MNSEEKEPQKKISDSLRTYAKYSGMGFQMMAIIGVFAWLGYKLDQKMANANPWFTIVGCLSGVALSTYQIIKQLKS